MGGIRIFLYKKFEAGKFGYRHINLPLKCRMSWEEASEVNLGYNERFGIKSNLSCCGLFLTLEIYITFLCCSAQQNRYCNFSFYLLFHGTCCRVGLTSDKYLLSSKDECKSS